MRIYKQFYEWINSLHEMEKFLKQCKINSNSCKEKKLGIMASKEIDSIFKILTKLKYSTRQLTE